MAEEKSKLIVGLTVDDVHEMELHLQYVKGIPGAFEQAVIWFAMCFLVSKQEILEVLKR